MKNNINISFIIGIVNLVLMLSTSLFIYLNIIETRVVLVKLLVVPIIISFLLSVLGFFYLFKVVNITINLKKWIAFIIHLVMSITSLILVSLILKASF